MSKKDMERAMADRSPLRKPIEPVEFYPNTEVTISKETDESDKSEPIKTDKPPIPAIDAPIQKKDQNETMSERSNGKTERSEQTKEDTSVLSEILNGVDQNKRRTERYSFEIFTDQKDRIEELQYMYKRRTGKKVSSSRLIREALESFLDQALNDLV